MTDTHKTFYDAEYTFNWLKGKKIKLIHNEYKVEKYKTGRGDGEWYLDAMEGYNKDIKINYCTILTGTCSAVQIHRHGEYWSKEKLEDTVYFFAQLGINTVMVSVTGDEDAQKAEIESTKLFRFAFTAQGCRCEENEECEDDGYLIHYYVSTLRRGHDWLRYGYIDDHEELFGIPQGEDE